VRSAVRIPENGHSQEQAQPAGLAAENAELLAEHAGHVERLPLTGHGPRSDLSATFANGLVDSAVS
jgi:hypothetical protein